jgi:hypothetical protein
MIHCADPSAGGPWYPQCHYTDKFHIPPCRIPSFPAQICHQIDHLARQAQRRIYKIWSVNSSIGDSEVLFSSSPRSHTHKECVLQDRIRRETEGIQAAQMQRNTYVVQFRGPRAEAESSTTTTWRAASPNYTVQVSSRRSLCSSPSQCSVRMTAREEMVQMCYFLDCLSMDLFKFCLEFRYYRQN